MEKCPIENQSECPVNRKQSPHDSCSLNPDTMMPYPENLDSIDCDPGLSKCREKSSIPRTNSDTLECANVWVYPSSHMFYAALKRKGYETSAEHIDTMVSIHNQLNENVWQEILKWEEFKSNQCSMGPTLHQFRGRYDTLSPKARIYKLFGVTPPFDRHDWIIDRCGKKVRYIIDYYSGHPEPDGTPTMHVDIRPDMNSLENITDRLRMTILDCKEWLHNLVSALIK